MYKKREPYFRSTFEMGIILIAIGGTFLILGLLYLWEVIDITSTFASSIAISGFLFVLSDSLKILAYKKHQPTNKRDKVLTSVLYLFRILCLIGSLVTLIGLPYILNTSEKMDVFATGFSIMAIGLTIVNMACNYTFENLDDIAHLLKIAETHSQHAERAIEISEKLLLQAESQIPDTNKQSPKRDVEISEKEV